MHLLAVFNGKARQKNKIKSNKQAKSEIEKNKQTRKWKIQNYPKQDVVKGKNPL